MKILILSRSPKAHFNVRLQKEGRKLGIKIDVINPLDCSFSHHRVINQDKPLEGYALGILRTPPYREDKEYFHMAARILEMSGVPVINNPSSVEICGNKFHTSIYLARASMPVMPSAAVHQSDQLDKAVEGIGGYPVFLKTIYGTRGIGVIFCPGRETLHACAQTLWAYKANVIVERYARNSNGQTVRLLVLFNKVLGAARCVPDETEAMAKLIMEGDEDSHGAGSLLRSNYSRGGKLEIMKPTALQKNLAIEAARILGLEFAGVDIIQDGTKWKVLEVNSAPGIKGLELASNKNVAKKVLQMIKTRLET